MRVSVLLAAVAALVVALLVVVVGRVVLQPDLPLITSAEFSLEAITPNADGEGDVTTFSYGLSRNANVSLTFEAEDGTVYSFRHDQPRIPDDYMVDFSGVVAGYVLPGEAIEGEVVRRLMPDGVYTWRLLAVDSASGESDTRTGTFTVQDADLALPEITTFTVYPEVFTPNQDSISDWTEVNIYLEKEADLQVYLLDENGQQLFIAPRQEGRKPGEAGRHTFNYDAGVEIGADPPPDGVYPLIAQAQDAEGQIIRQAAELTIQNGGKPRAEIVPQSVGVDVVFAVEAYDERYLTTAEQAGELVAPPDDPRDLSLTTLSIPIGEMLVFKVTVENYSDIPIRTSGPPPGTVYQQTQRAATFKAFDESGAWRVGLDCTTAESDYPWRWAIGTDDDLVEVVDEASGNTYKYLMPGARAVVWGAVRMTELEVRNPQNCWAGLIHEDVMVYNQNVGSREVEIVTDSSEN